MERPSSLGIGVVCDVLPSAWHVRCVEAILGVEGVEPRWLLVTARAPGDGTPSYRVLRRMLLDPTSRALRPAGLGTIRRRFPTVLTAEREDVVIRAGERPVDVVVWLADGPPPADLAHVGRYGVWWYVHGDAAGGRARAAALHELASGATTVRSRLVRDVGSHRETLAEGVFAVVAGSWPKTVDAAILPSTGWAARACRDVLVGAGPLPGPGGLRAPAWRRPARPGTPPRARDVGRVAARVAAHRVADTWRRFGRAFHWNVGIADAPIWRFLDPATRPPIQWLPDPGPRFYADPFAWEHDGKLQIAVEDYDYGVARGAIAILAPRGDVVERSTVLDLPVHLSYPYLFEHEGRRYGVPESSAAGEVVLYAADGGGWKRLKTLIPGFAGVDSTVFRHDGLWWLLCTNALDHACTNLYAFYAEDPLGEWTPHARNPVKSDVRCSRPGGTPFVHQGELYRPAQDCGAMYGSALAINRVLELTPTSFREEVATVLRPDPNGPYPHGLHTLCAVGDRTVVDGQRWLRFVDAPATIAKIRWTMTRRRFGPRL